jgi:hypothetical protein
MSVSHVYLFAIKFCLKETVDGFFTEGVTC